VRHSPTPPFAQIEVFSDLVEFRHTPPAGMKSRRGRGVAHSLRGKVTDFTPKSRTRLIRKMAKIRTTRHGYFLTLTYPDVFPFEAQAWKNHLHTFTIYLQRRFPGCAGLWRMEFKVRKSGEVHEGYIAPHFHVLVFGVALPQEAEWRLRRWVSETWARIVNSDDHRHIKAGTNVRPIKNRKHAYRYVAKYAAKLHTGEFSIVANVGRHWGKFGDLQVTSSVLLSFSKGNTVIFRRLVRDLLESRGTPSAARYARVLARDPPHMGFSVLGLGDNISIGHEKTPGGASFRLIEASTTSEALLGIQLNALNLPL